MSHRFYNIISFGGRALPAAVAELGPLACIRTPWEFRHFYSLCSVSRFHRASEAQSTNLVAMIRRGFPLRRRGELESGWSRIATRGRSWLRS